MAAIATSIADRSLLLRRSLQANAALTGLMGLALLVAAGPLATLTGLPAMMLWPDGAVLLAYAAWLGYQSTRPTIGRGVALTAIVLDVLWVVGSMILLFGGLLPLTAAGWWIVLVQALIAADFAILQYIGLRRLA